MISVTDVTDFESWKIAAKKNLANKVEPNALFWTSGSQGAFAFEEKSAVPESPGDGPSLTVPKEFVSLAKKISHVRDADRWDLLYRLLFRLKYENPNLLSVYIDDDVVRARGLEKAIGRDLHKMHAFVRFKKRETENGDTYVAWYEPEHLILPLAAPFFERRFGDKPWSIFTPDGSVHWDLQRLIESPGLALNEFREVDAFDEVWKTYYKSIFNPARIKLRAMASEMPEKYWTALPEAEIIHQLVREAPNRLQMMRDRKNDKASPPETNSWKELRSAALECTACPLYKLGTQTVFGEGPVDSSIMIVGEQPGNAEDLEGRPFVGPAGHMLNEALSLSELDRQSVYVTNAVKHFKWVQRGKVRLHQKPSGSEMSACQPWLASEIKKVQPKVILALGATAATSLLGRQPRLTHERGQILKSKFGDATLILSWHPAFILRSPDEAAKKQHFAELVQDMQLAKTCLIPH